MTDEELYTLFDDSDDPSDGMAGYRALYQAGYRKGLDGVRHLMDQLAEEDHREGAERDWWKLSRWVDEQLKEQP